MVPHFITKYGTAHTPPIYIGGVAALVKCCPTFRENIMKKRFTYTLDLSSKKFNCPSCGKRTFVRYKDHSGNYHQDESFGRCDREHNCGFLNIPKDDIRELTIADFAPKVKPKEKPISFIPVSHAKQSWKNYDKNNLILWLVSKIGDKQTVELIKRYRLGVAVPNDYIIFWQFDIDNRIRSGKMIKYNPDGKRCKDSMTTWYHKRSDGFKDMFPDFNLKQCFFGEHLLREYPRMPVAIVESEKTAIIASHFIDKYIWLSCGGKGGLGFEKCQVLKNRSVTLFPDLGAYDDWKGKAKQFKFSISNHIEKIATKEQREQGLDIADFLII